MMLEFTYDAPEAAPLDTQRRAEAHGELSRWLAGNHENNNPFRAMHT